jgi:hypothetical protein
MLIERRQPNLRFSVHRFDPVPTIIVSGLVTAFSDYDLVILTGPRRLRLAIPLDFDHHNTRRQGGRTSVRGEQKRRLQAQIAWSTGCLLGEAPGACRRGAGAV